jgi:hypothetical protein
MMALLLAKDEVQIPIPMYEKKFWVQQENLYKITYCLRLFQTYLQYTCRA